MLRRSVCAGVNSTERSHVRIKPTGSQAFSCSVLTLHESPALNDPHWAIGFIRLHGTSKSECENCTVPTSTWLRVVYDPTVSRFRLSAPNNQHHV
jgi:hypothetical protein